MKDLALVSGLRVVNSGFKPNAVEEPMVKDKFFPDVKQVSYQAINQASVQQQIH